MISEVSSTLRISELEDGNWLSTATWTTFDGLFSAFPFALESAFVFGAFSIVTWIDAVSSTGGSSCFGLMFSLYKSTNYSSFKSESLAIKQRSTNKMKWERKIPSLHSEPQQFRHLLQTSPILFYLGHGSRIADHPQFLRVFYRRRTLELGITHKINELLLIIDNLGVNHGKINNI